MTTSSREAGIKAVVDEQHRLILPADIAQQYQPGQEIEISLNVPNIADANPFLAAIGLIPPLPGGAVAFIRDLRGHNEAPDE